MKETPLLELASVIRSKNCSPFSIALDVIFNADTVFDTVRRKNLLNRNLIASCYQIPEDYVRDVIYFKPARAVKIVLKRSVPSGTAGDSDVYGAQQHAPLLQLKLPIEEKIK